MTSLTVPIASHPVGGTNPDRFDWREAWYPVHYSADLDKTRPTAFTLLDRDIVIWWDRNQNGWRVFEDKCPHRLAPLSEGRVNEAGHLECPYHGWSFSGEGTCEAIPQQPAGTEAETSRRACATALPATVCQGLLFVYAGDPDHAPHTPVPIIEPMETDPEGWICLNTFRDLPYDALTLIENVLDSSHVPYTHHLTIGNRANASPVNLEVVASDRQGFTGVWPEGPRRGTLGKQFTTFIAPSLMWHDLTSQQFGRTLTVVYATPIRQGECRLFARFPFKFSSPFPKFFLKLTPTWYSHINQNAILEDDQIFLYLQERYLQESGGGENFLKAFYLPTKADLFVFQFRSWVNQYNAAPFPGIPLPPQQPREVILERYHSHTKHCASCQGALRNLNRWRGVLAVLTGLMGISLPLLSLLVGEFALPIVAVLTGLTLVSAGLWWRLGMLKPQFYVGRELLPRNTGKKG